MRNFIYNAFTKIIFGKNSILQLSSEIQLHGSKVLFLYGGESIKRSGLHAEVVKQLTNHQIQFVELSGVQPNPRLSKVKEGIELCRKEKVDFILAVGGGSVIDCAKSIAAGVEYDGDVWDFYLRKAKVLAALPIGTILTLAATGSEMNGNSVISNEALNSKRATGSDLLRPQFSILDPTYTFSVDKWQTASGTVDIMSHVFEQYFTLDQGTFIQDAIAEGLLKTAIKYGPIAIAEPENYEARANLMWASSLALNGLTVTGKASGDFASHQIEHELSAFYDLTHGVGLAIVFPNWMYYVLDETTAPKLAQYGRNVWGVTNENDRIAAQEAIAHTRTFFNSLGMPATLSEVKISDEKFETMSQNACLFGTVGSFKKLESNDVLQILKSCQ